jgi:hypothetical protein
MTKLIILGASGHGKVVAEIAEECGFVNGNLILAP